MARIYVLLIVLKVLAILLQSAESASLLKITGLTCESDKQKLEFTLCELKAVKRDVSEISLRANVYQKPINNITLIYNIKRRGYDHLKPLLTFTADVCAFFRNKKRNPIIALTYKLLGFAKYSNMNHTCPYGHDLVVDKYRFDQNDLALLPLPAAHYTIYTKWIVFGETWSIVKVNFGIFDT